MGNYWGVNEGLIVLNGMNGAGWRNSCGSSQNTVVPASSEALPGRGILMLDADGEDRSAVFEILFPNKFLVKSNTGLFYSVQLSYSSVKWQK